MITKNAVLNLPLYQSLEKYNQIYKNSCWAATLDFLYGNEKHEFQKLWNGNRSKYADPDNIGKTLDEDPAPTGNEIKNFHDDMYDKGLLYEATIYMPILNLNESERNKYVEKINTEILQNDFFIFGNAGHAMLIFRQEKRIFKPSLEDENSMIFEEEKIPIDFNIDNNGLLYGKEYTPIVVTGNLLI